MRFGAAKIDEARKVVYVQEILDATRFVGVWMGQTYECRAIPDTTDFTAGDNIVCHVMPGNSELIAVRPVGEVELLFVSVGGLDGYTPTVWMFTDPAIAPTKVFEQADTGVDRLVTAMAWCQATNSLIFVCSASWGGGWTHDIYEYHFGDPAPTLRHSYDPDTLGIWAACMDMAEWGGKLYFWNSGSDDPSILYRCDPRNIAASFEIVLQTAGPYRFDPGEGGLAIVGGNIYALDGDRLYSSASGDSGSWAQVADLWTLNNEGAACALVTDPGGDCAYFSTLRYVHGASPDSIWRCIRRINGDGSLTLEHQEGLGGYDDFTGAQFSSITLPYPPSAASQPAALQWYAWPSDVGHPRPRTHDVYRRQGDGSWAFEDAGWQDPAFAEPCAGGWGGLQCGNWWTLLGCNQGSVYWRGRPYVIVDGDWLRVDLTAADRRLLMAQTAVGNWELVYEFDGYSSDVAAPNHHFSASMTVGRTTKLIQNL